MELMVLVCVILYISYGYLQKQISSSEERIRACLFMLEIQRGENEANANEIVSFGSGECTPELRRRANDYIGNDVAGNHIKLIASAYQSGMTQKLPTWQKLLMAL